ncbi:MAG: DUF885 domain-containing protein [Alphaproteobacteria bacterium]|nr:DUF885 domain-containing protein [Alphaproteobacteria bacterium]MBV9695028.1 DUF885 domain-containing protein [Alphaproteobacteria bacterium]
MKKVLGVTGAVLALLLIAAGAFVYELVWKHPLRFNWMLDRQAVAFVVDRPQELSAIGFVDGTWFDFHSGKLDSYSLVERQENFRRLRDNEAEIRRWNRADLAPQEQLSYDIVLWSYDRTLADAKYPWLGADDSLYPVNPAFGIQKNLPNFLLSTHPIRNARLARHYVDRLRALGAVLDAVTADVARQALQGVIPPDFIVDGNIAQIGSLIAPPPDKNALVRNLADKTAKIGMDDGERRELIDEATAAVRDVVYPAYRRMIAEEQALRPRATHDAGVWRLKGGAEYYADQLKQLTASDMTPDEIHAYGLSEVARISAEADAVLKTVGLEDGTVGARLDKLMADPRFLYANDDAGRARMLAHYKELLGHVRALLPRYFASLPRAELDVRRVPPFSEKGSAGAYYEPPALDGSKPGIFFANLRNVAETPMWAMPTLAYHEGIPGHHLQIATAMEIPGLPLLRRFQFIPAFSEGWALYAEHLAKDIGLYRGDPYGDLGRLQAELFRAARLVVDTGMHAKHWSREQAIAYMQSVTGMAPSDVTAEVERYVVWPGQACAYKIGMKTILDLREKAKAKLGPRFDLKGFHALVLENGAMPLWLLQENVERWIAERQRR